MSVVVTFTPYQKQRHQELAKKWLSISTKVDSNFFLSWDWISSWLLNCDADILIVEAKEKDKPVALALIGQSSRRVFKLFTVKQWHLNKSGLQKFDQPWIEYNDILAINSHAKQALLAAIVKAPQWQELIIGMAKQCITDPGDLLSISNRVVIESIGYRFDFNVGNSELITDSFSKNTRQKLNKNQRSLEQLGKLKFEVVTNTDNILSTLPTIAQWHITRWQDNAQASGFNNKYFSQFVRCLISSNDQVTAQLACLHVGDDKVGYLLNFIDDKQVYFYLSAIDNNFAPSINIGNAMHSLAITHYQSEGMVSYDFLLGDYQYKRSLSNQKYSQKMQCYFRNSFALQVENIARKLKHKFKLIN